MSKKMLVFLLIILTSSLATYLYVLLFGVVSIFVDPVHAQEYGQKLTRDLGMTLIASQEMISESVHELANTEEISPTYAGYLIRQIVAGWAFTWFLIFGVFTALGFFYRKNKTEFSKWFLLFFLSVFIVGAIQVSTTFILTGQAVWPYMGFIDTWKNGEAILEAVNAMAPAIV